MDDQKPEGRTRKRWSIPPGKRGPTLGRSSVVQMLLDELGAKGVKAKPGEAQGLVFENPKQQVSRSTNQHKVPELSNRPGEHLPPDKMK